VTAPGSETGAGQMQKGKASAGKVVPKEKLAINYNKTYDEPV